MGQEPIQTRHGAENVTDEIDREAIRRAYEDGFSDGADHNNLAYKYPPCEVAWLEWKQSQPNWPRLTEEELATIAHWYALSHKERYET